MQKIDTIDALEALYGAPSEAALRKVSRRMTPCYRRWIAASRFCVLATVGPEGCDATPRGEDGPVVQEVDPATLILPDWRGNNRLDSLRNIVVDGRVALVFMVPGNNIVVRVNGRAIVTDDADMRARFVQAGRQPATVIVVDIAEIYAQCPKALMRAGLWTRGDASGLPSLGEILSEMTSGDIAAQEWDQAYPTRAAETLW